MLKYSGKKLFKNTCGFTGRIHHWNHGYLFFILLIAVVTPFYNEYPRIVISFFLLELGVVVYQKYIAQLVQGRIKEHTRFRNWLIIKDIHVAVIIWSVFALTTLFLFGMSLPGILVLMISASLVSISLSMMVPICSPVRTYVLILIAPMGIWGAFSQSRMGFFLLFLTVLQFIVIRRDKKMIYEKESTMECFNQRTSELVKINKELESEILYRKNMEKALRRSEERYRTLFQNNPIETIIVDHNARITGYNSAKARSLGRVPEIGDIMYKDYGSKHKNNMFEELMDCIETGRQKEFPEQKYNERFLHIRISPYSGGAIITSLDITKTKRAEEQIQTLTREIMRVQENERKRIARDLHDSVAQDLSSLRISCETFFDGNSESSMDVRKKIKGISHVLHGSINAIRDIAYELRPPCLDELGLSITLYRYCEEFSTRSGIHVDFFSAGLEQFRIDPDSEINLYRLVQEALNNIRKHSKANNATIRLVASYPHVILRIDDNGIGFEADLQSTIGLKNKHMGLRSMEERVNLMGGRIRLKSCPGSGTRLFVEVPICKKINEWANNSTDEIINH
ncbi:MAG: PAS domain-containing protein [Proteobacteria bacterium]|nr:PAS domain-containing protein [Pseudomonadota bacterium]